MIVWKKGSVSLDLGEAAKENCKTCGQIRPFHLFLEYRYITLYWIFGMVTQRRYFYLCYVCRQGREITRSESREFLLKEPIPLKRQYGLALFAIYVVASFVFVLLYDRAYWKW